MMSSLLSAVWVNLMMSLSLSCMGQSDDVLSAVICVSQSDDVLPAVICMGQSNDIMFSVSRVYAH